MCVFFSIFVITGVPGEALPVTSEEDVFDYIGMAYKKPSERNMWGLCFEAKIVKHLKEIGHLDVNAYVMQHIRRGDFEGEVNFWVFYFMN